MALLSKFAFIISLSFLLPGLVPQAAFSAESSYTKLNFERDCKFAPPASEEEAGMGGSGICRIAGKPTIYFDDGDLRHSAGFGAAKKFESFAQFNSMNTTIEWRHVSGDPKPHAAIVRWFIENANPATGDIEKKREGQVLVISQVARQPGDPSCIVGMVDARANSNANVLARQIADEVAIDFQCGAERATYHGKIGPYAGTPSF